MKPQLRVEELHIGSQPYEVRWTMTGQVTMCQVVKFSFKYGVDLPICAGLTRYNPKDRFDYVVGMRESARHACYVGLPGAPEMAAPKWLRAKLFSAIRQVIWERYVEHIPGPLAEALMLVDYKRTT